MPLEEFPARNVSPGEPVTADAWNEIVDGIRAINDHVRTTVASTLAVRIGNTGLDLAGLTVIANRQDGPQVVQAVQDPAADGIVFSFSELPAGVYLVRAAAPGFAVASQAVTAPDDSEISLTLLPEGGLMPDLFGLPLQQGLKQLADLGVEVSRVLDITGRDVAPANPGSDYANSPILVQVPAPGKVVPTTASVRLAVAAALREEPSVEVPSLTGLSLKEARKALESIGLVLGEVETRKS